MGILTTSNGPGLNSDIDMANYSKKVLDYFINPRNVGAMDENSDRVGTGVVGSQGCGDVMRLQIEVDDNGEIVDAKFKTFGCASAIASTSLVTEWVKGRNIHQAGEIKNIDIARELSLSPIKIHCSVLAEDVIKAAIDDWKKKNHRSRKA